MGDVFRLVLTAPGRSPRAAEIAGPYLGVVIVATVAATITPIELFLLEVWPRHGYSSLLLVLAPLLFGGVFARLLPHGYYRPRRWESTRLYERIGVRYFKRLVPDGDYVNRRIRRAEPRYRVVHDRASIAEFEARTRLAEQCHIVSLWLPIPCAVYALLLGWPAFALWMLLSNVPFHLYPVLLQRYSRVRIQGVGRTHGGTAS